MGSSVLRKIKLGVILTLILCSIGSHGATVGLLVEDNNKQAQGFKAQLEKHSPDNQFILYTFNSLPKTLLPNTADKWLAMGPKSLGVLLGRASSKTHILGLFVRHQARQKLQTLYPKQSFSILDNTPPLERQLGLIKVLSPKIKNVAIFYGERDPKELSKELQIAESLGINIRTTAISDPLNWDRQSLKVLKDSDMILGVQDSAIFNATTIRSILMRLYRASTPLIGPDKGYVRAGAVASTYSGVKETITQVVELLAQKEPWPERIINRHFNVSVNRQVARSLNINVSDIENLPQKIKEVLK